MLANGTLGSDDTPLIVLKSLSKSPLPGVTALSSLIRMKPGIPALPSCIISLLWDSIYNIEKVLLHSWDCFYDYMKLINMKMAKKAGNT